MVTRIKALNKMRNNPRDWRIEQLEDIAKHYGIVVRKSGGSHVVFDHPSLEGMLCVPARKPIKPVYIKYFLMFIDKLEELDHENA